MSLSERQIENINKRLNILQPQLEAALAHRNLKDAKNLLAEVNPLLKSVNKTIKLVQYRNSTFELALDHDESEFAIEGLLVNRKLVNKSTRTFLEATTLLAIAYLRQDCFEDAQTYMTEVLTNDTVIKTEATRIKFRQEAVERFNHEVTLYSLRKKSVPPIELDALHQMAMRIFDCKEPDAIYADIGSETPQETKNILFLVNSFSLKQLPYSERKLLPSSSTLMENKESGKTVFSSFKRVLYKSLCDPNSEVYKAWYSNGLAAFVDKRFITSAVGLALFGIGIAAQALIASVAALVLRFGLDIYCEHYKPVNVSELRRKS